MDKDKKEKINMDKDKEEKINEAFYAAAVEGDLVKFDEAVAMGADLRYLSPTDYDIRSPLGCIGRDDIIGDGDNSALHAACHEGFVPIIERLLDLDASLVDCKNSYLQTPLILAILHGHDKVAELLLNRGAGINEKDNYECSPLHYASSYGRVGIVELLLARGANNLADAGYYESFPIHCAAEWGHEEVVDILSKWPLIEVVILLKEIGVYHECEALFFIDIWQYII